ncbi:hypothetical protein C0J52_02982 [Blattella germanica]|nr:hypothetical protein C0J52_02982 [Blattella germanica]
MAGPSGLHEEEIVALLENDDILSDFSFGESDSENIEDSASDSSESNSDITDVEDHVGLPTQPACASEWRNVSNDDPGPSRIIPVANIDSGPVLPSSFDSSTEPIEFFQLFFDGTLYDLIVTETNIYGNTKRQT